MINRIIIRIKVLQIVYAYYQKNSMDLALAENELMFSLKKSYDLYHYLILMILLLTDAEQKRLDKMKNKLLATESDLNPNRRLADNRFAAQLNKNKQLQKFTNEKGTFWNNEDNHLVKLILNEILESDIYSEYLKSKDVFESDKRFWLNVFKKIILNQSEISEILEGQSIYWNDDLDVIGSFVLKTLRGIKQDTPPEQGLYPMFKDEKDKEFAFQLLHHALLEGKENTKRITNQINNWETERLAIIDLYIIQIALSEIRNFPTIPINVSLNEYIELSRYYSTPKSPIFVNGILDAIVKELKSENLLFKD